MNEVFILEHEFDFKDSLHEITSIAIEYKYDVELSRCVGEFIISGDYRPHEISINREEFNFKLPFETEIRSNINLDSLEVEITDFTYEYNDNTLTVHIEYNVNGEQAIIEFAEEADLEEFLKANEVDVINFSEEERIAEAEELEEIKEVEEDNKINQIEEEILEIEETEIEENTEEQAEEEERILETKSIEDYIEDNMPKSTQTITESETELEGEKLLETVENKKNEIEEIKAVETNTQESRIDGESIIESINSEENYVTYYVHTVTSADNFESISNQYNVSVSYIKKINNIEELELGMKLIIPDEEN